ncbi:hypothetical protein [Halomonas sp. SpR8]|nr:hypothetical protein [Halomonas sp. SpR8]MDQ7729790.1 hypothetical protein [Halomonas sp. SpR8]
MRTGNINIVYKLDGDAIQVLIIAEGARRDKEVYKIANRRVK